MRSPSELKTEGGSDLHLPPGYFLDEPTFDRLDAETRRLQEAETRLTAENNSFRSTASSWHPGWYTAAGIILSGFALGWYAHAHL